MKDSSDGIIYGFKKQKAIVAVRDSNVTYKEYYPSFKLKLIGFEVNRTAFDYGI